MFMLEYRSMSWWYWLVTVGFLTAGVSGWSTGFLFAIGLTVFQLVHFTIHERQHCLVPNSGTARISAATSSCVSRESPADLLDSSNRNMGASSVWLLHDGSNGISPAMEPQRSILIRAS